MYGAFSCPTWVTPNDLLVSYYKGPFPESAKLPKPIAGQGIAVHGSPNTAMLLHLTPAGVEARDLAGLWQVEVIDLQGRFAVVNLLASEGALQAGYRCRQRRTRRTARWSLRICRSRMHRGRRRTGEVLQRQAMDGKEVRGMRAYGQPLRLLSLVQHGSGRVLTQAAIENHA